MSASVAEDEFVYDPVLEMLQEAAEHLDRARAQLADPARQFAVTSSGKLHTRGCSFVTLASPRLTAQDVAERCLTFSELLTVAEARKHLAKGRAFCKRCRPRP